MPTVYTWFPICHDDLGPHAQSSVAHSCQTRSSQLLSKLPISTRTVRAAGRCRPARCTARSELCHQAKCTSACDHGFRLASQALSRRKSRFAAAALAVAAAVEASSSSAAAAKAAAAKAVAAKLMMAAVEQRAWETQRRRPANHHCQRPSACTCRRHHEAHGHAALDAGQLPQRGASPSPPSTTPCALSAHGGCGSTIAYGGGNQMRRGSMLPN